MGPDLKLSNDLRKVTYASKKRYGDNTVQTIMPMTNGRYQISVKLAKTNHKNCSVCIGIAKKFKDYGTYNTQREFSCWLYCEDGMTRQDGQRDYKDYAN